MRFRRGRPHQQGRGTAKNDAAQRAAARVASLCGDPAASLHSELGKLGHTLPDTAVLINYDLDLAEDVQQVSGRHGLTVSQGSSSRGNVVAVHPDLAAPRLKVLMEGSDSVIILGPNAAVVGEFLTANESLIVIAGHPKNRRELHLRVTLRDRGVRFFWGAGSSSGGFHTSVKGDGVALIVADDCMVSWGVWGRPYDMHLIIDPVTGEVINPARDVIVGPHVWIGQNSLLLPGARVGAGSIVGANSVVAGKAYPAMGLHVGQPARTVRRPVTWDRDSVPSVEAIERARDVYAQYSGGDEPPS